MGYLRTRWARSIYFPTVSSHYPNEFVKYRQINPKIPLSTERQILDHYQELCNSNDSDATMKLHHIIISMRPRTTRIYEFRGQSINDKKTENKNYEYYYVCTYDPTGNRLGHKHTHKEMKPITPKPWVFQVLGPKNTYYYVAHYNSKKYKQDMKKYKEGKIKTRPNGSKPCYLGSCKANPSSRL